MNPMMIDGTIGIPVVSAMYALKNPTSAYDVAHAKWNRPVTATMRPKLRPIRP